MLSLLLIIVFSYLVGSIPASIWIGKGIYGIDIRQHGSGNAGATNAFRVMGWKAGTLTTLVDAGKGFLAAGGIALLRVDPINFSFGSWDTEVVIQLIACLCAVIGHMFPVWARFKGGKGANTAAGALLAITPVTMLIVLSVFFLVLLTTRYVSLASLLSALSFPLVIILGKFVFNVEHLDLSLLVFGTVMGLGIFWAHRQNIKRLLKGTENRVGSFKPSKGQLKREET